MKKRTIQLSRYCVIFFFIFYFNHPLRAVITNPNTEEEKTSPTDANRENIVEAVLNGLKITVNKETGSIIGLEYPGPGKILEAKPEQSGLIDIAYPIPEFEALRLASRYSTGASISKTANEIIISYDNLGASRSYFKPQGTVAVKIWIKAMDDGRSVSMKCRVENNTDLPIDQVMFPDLHGLQPLGGTDGTYLRTAGFVRKPFVDVGATTYPEFYALDDRTRPIDIRNTYVYTGGRGVGNGDEMIGRWLDFGGLSGGVSMFPAVWEDAPVTKVRIFRLEKDPNVRLMHVHKKTIKKGETWHSPEYVLTPHQNGWAKGIETYKAFVKSQMDRLFPMPKHVREGLGFRTVLMGTRAPADGDLDVVYKISDLPKVAKECKENGLDELMVWAWRPSFVLPGKPPYPNLGTPEDLTKAIKECNEIGVNVALFESIISIGEATAAKYGLKIGKLGWTYHPEMMPMFNPSYAKGFATTHADTKDPRWQKDALADIKMLYDTYTHSIGWDQAHPGTEEVFKQFLPWVKKTDPRATFAAEITHGVERLVDYLDYSWNWQLGSYHHNLMQEYRDVRGFTAAFPAPRLNYNISRNAQDIKYAFMDNSYVNLMPTAPDGINGSAMIADYPELGHVLKQCASVRKQFLKYFTEGSLIGECLLNEECPDAHINAYVLPDRVLFMVMNTADKARQVNFSINLEPWLKSETGKYEVRSYDQYGTHYGENETVGSAWRGMTQQLRNMDFAIYEFVAE